MQISTINHQPLAHTLVHLRVHSHRLAPPWLPSGPSWGARMQQAVLDCRCGSRPARAAAAHRIHRRATHPADYDEDAGDVSDHVPQV